MKNLSTGYNFNLVCRRDRYLDRFFLVIIPRQLNPSKKAWSFLSQICWWPTNIMCFLSKICSWMVVNKLKLNLPKTEVIILQLKHDFRKHGEFQIKVGEAVIQPSSTVRNLVFYMDHYNSCELHVNSLCKEIYFHKNCIGRARRVFISCYFTICCYSICFI